MLSPSLISELVGSRNPSSCGTVSFPIYDIEAVDPFIAEKVVNGEVWNSKDETVLPDRLGLASKEGVTLVFYMGDLISLSETMLILSKSSSLIWSRFELVSWMKDTGEVVLVVLEWEGMSERANESVSPDRSINQLMNLDVIYMNWLIIALVPTEVRVSINPLIRVS